MTGSLGEPGGQAQSHQGPGQPPARMPLGGVPRASLLRALGVVVITATITIAAACSDEDTVDTVPPPWPTATESQAGPQGVPDVPPSVSVPTNPMSSGTGLR